MNEDTHVQSITTRFEELAGDRAGLESVWREIVEVCFVGGPKVEYLDSMGGRTYETVWSEPQSARRSRRVYDLTGALALDRVSAGIESLITPQGQQWHELAFEDPQAPQPTLDEETWLDLLADYLFGVRYDPRSGWLLSHQRALVSTLALGTGVYYVEEAFGTRDRSEAQIPFRYVPVPLNEAYLATNDFGEHNTNIRSFRLSAIQAYEKWGDANSHTVKTKANDPARMDQTSQFLHAVVPTEQVDGADTDFAFTSIYIDLDHKHTIGVGGFHEFPFAIYTWTQPGRLAYGESPAMVALPEMKTVQVMSRDSVLASQLNIRPPVATAYELDRPVNLNPGAINPKMVDPNTGRPLIASIIGQTDPRLAETTIELRRQAIRQALYTDLFAVLVDKPNMSATEAMIRAQEKGELLGPAASRIQVGLSRLVDREIGILARKGAFSPDALLTPPNSVEGRDVGVRFTGPIDRARQLPEVTGMQQTLEFAAGLAQIDPNVMDNFDTDAMLDRARYLLGAPPLAQRDPDLVDRLRQEKAQAASQMAATGAAQQMVDTAGGLTDAAEGLGAMSELAQQAGIDPRQIAGIPQQG
jgi:hypothetical protein